MATIYFSGSISGGREDLPTYQRLVRLLEAAGHHVLAGAVAAEHIGAGGESLSERDIFLRDLGWIDDAAGDDGILLAEVSRPSLGVGYEIAYARYQHRMRVICLYRPAYTALCTAMISGDEAIELIRYTDETFDEMSRELLARLAG